MKVFGEDRCIITITKNNDETFGTIRRTESDGLFKGKLLISKQSNEINFTEVKVEEDGGDEEESSNVACEEANVL